MQFGGPTKIHRKSGFGYTNRETAPGNLAEHGDVFVKELHYENMRIAILVDLQNVFRRFQQTPLSNHRAGRTILWPPPTCLSERDDSDRDDHVQYFCE
jgi:hypothetical protein